MSDTKLPSGASHPDMGRIKAKNTAPELKLRRLLIDMGYGGYRIHYGELPGKPDIVFTKRKKIIFTHGCFWHRHNCKKGKSMPQTNKNFWETKFKNNIIRDEKSLRKLRKEGWRVLIVWECQLKNPDRVRKRLEGFLAE